VRDLDVAEWRIYVEFERWRVYCPRCRSLFVEQLDWLAENPRYTRRFARYVEKLWREMTNKAAGELARLHHTTVKDLDKRDMAQQVKRAPMPAPRAIGIDDIAIRKGHAYRIVVSDLDLRPVLRCSRGEDVRSHQDCGDGHVAGLPQLDHATCPSGAHHLRQVPHHQPSLRRPR